MLISLSTPKITFKHNCFCKLKCIIIINQVYKFKGAVKQLISIDPKTDEIQAKKSAYDDKI